MYKDIENYQPLCKNYVIDEGIADKFPTELSFKDIEGCETMKETMQLIREKFTSVFPEGQVAMRQLDKFEKTAIREEYCILQEEELPKLQEKYLDLKQQMKDAEAELKGKIQEISRYAMEVRAGVREQRLKASETFQIALCGYYLTYTWDAAKEEFLLAKAFEIPDRTELWADDTQNKEAFSELFGMDFTDDTDTESDGLPFGK